MIRHRMMVGADRSEPNDNAGRSFVAGSFTVEPPPPPPAPGGLGNGAPPLRAPPAIFFPMPSPARAPVRSGGEPSAEPTAPGPGAGDRAANAKLTAPDPEAHFAVRALWAAMRLQGVRVGEMASKSGLAVSTLENWHSGYSQPTLAALDRALAAVGLRLTVEPRQRGN
jgi:DNA-binding phage protein